jgi:hypothetical protein
VPFLLVTPAHSRPRQFESPAEMRRSANCPVHDGLFASNGCTIDIIALSAFVREKDAATIDKVAMYKDDTFPRHEYQSAIVKTWRGGRRLRKNFVDDMEAFAYVDGDAEENETETPAILFDSSLSLSFSFGQVCGYLNKTALPGWLKIGFVKLCILSSSVEFH